MKKLLIPILMLLPIMTQAQSTLTPQQQLEQAQKQLEEAKKAVEAAQKAAAAAENQGKDTLKQADAGNKGWEVPKAATTEKTGKKTATNTNGVVLKADPKYLADALTFDENGKIVFTLNTDANGKSAAQIYDLVYNYMNELTQGENNIASKVALVNKGENVIANTMDEWLVFSSSFISLDRTEIKYTLIATIKDNCLQVTLGRINYNYEPDRPTGFKDTAENIIIDKVALNKKKTALTKIFGKFRRCTIDRKDQIFKELTALVKQ